MAFIKPFRAIRPRADLAANVAALPYDVMTSEEARALVQGDPYSFLHVDKSEIDLPPETHLHDPVVYEKARDNLRAMIESGVLSRDLSPCLYLYRETMDGRVQTGLVACASIDDYVAGVIKKHENTRADKELDRIHHVDACNAQTGPIFLTYRTSAGINALIEKWIGRHRPVADFISSDKIGHTVWVIDDEEFIQTLTDAFAAVPNLYIADGHHRCASAVRVGLARREGSTGHTGNEEYNFFLAVLVPDTQIHIMAYHRVVRDLFGHTPGAFLAEAGKSFRVEPCADATSCAPENRHFFGMLLEGKWYRLEPKPGTFDPNDPVGSLDVSILQENLLAPILGIRDPRTDPRIDFVGGGRGLAELERRVATDMAVAFALYPVSAGEIMEIADEGGIMPPKSTWFEPKLRSGLFIHEI